MDCPPPLVSMETIALPNDDGSVFVVSTADTDTRQVVAAYDITQDEHRVVVSGGVDLANRRSRRSRIQYRWSRLIDDNWRPVLASDSPICYDYSKSMLVCLVEAEVDAGKSASESLDWSVPLHPAADINQDGTVDSADQGILFSDWGTDAVRSDLDRDGKVDGSDLGILNTRWGWTAPQQEGPNENP